jgi:hypothetical protein
MPRYSASALIPAARPGRYWRTAEQVVTAFWRPAPAGRADGTGDSW